MTLDFNDYLPGCRFNCYTFSYKITGMLAVYKGDDYVTVYLSRVVGGKINTLSIRY